MSFSFNLKYTPPKTEPSDISLLSTRLEGKIQTAVEQAALAGYGPSSVRVVKVDSGFQVTVEPSKAEPSKSLEGEAQEFDPAHDPDDLYPERAQTLLSSMSEMILNQAMPGLLAEILTVLRQRRGGK